MSFYTKWQSFIEEQISYQRWASRQAGEHGDSIRAEKSQERADKFAEMLLDAKKEGSHRPVNDVSLDNRMLDLLLLTKERRATIDHLIEELHNDGNTVGKPVILLRIGALVKSGKAWRMGNLIGLPGEKS